MYIIFTVHITVDTALGVSLDREFFVQKHMQRMNQCYRKTFVQVELLWTYRSSE
jgi:hypothetical protein